MALCLYYFKGKGYQSGMSFIVGSLLRWGFSPAEAYHMFIGIGINPKYLLMMNFDPLNNSKDLHKEQMAGKLVQAFIFLCQKQS